ncbi:MAG: 2-C-methyl-D-erythritol 4-phosphate cytidylyltransferase, partial [Alphaproteobacteria bacterium]
MSVNRVAALIMAAGHGARFGGDLPKQYQSLAGASPLRRAAAQLESMACIDDVCCVVAPDGEPHLDADGGHALFAQVIPGGPTRQVSVHNGLEALAAWQDPPDIVLIHDAARPLIPRSVVGRLLTALETAEAVAPALPLTDTLSRSDAGEFGEMIDRSGILRR